MGEEVAGGGCYAVVLLLMWERSQGALRLWEHFRYSMEVPASPQRSHANAFSWEDNGWGESVPPFRTGCSGFSEVWQSIPEICCSHRLGPQR